MKGLNQQIDRSFTDQEDELPGLESGDKFADYFLAMGRPDKFDVEIIVKLKASRDGSRAAQIPVAKLDGCPSERVEEMIKIAVDQSWFKEQLAGIVGEPSDEPLNVEGH